MAERSDYAFPFRIEAGSRQAQHADYEAHVAQMVREVLLTTPGERVNLPEFGCGLRALIFAGNSEVLLASVRMLVQQSLARWLSEHLTVRTVEVTPKESEIDVRVEYVLALTLVSRQVDVRVN